MSDSPLNTFVASIAAILAKVLPAETQVGVIAALNAADGSDAITPDEAETCFRLWEQLVFAADDAVIDAVSNAD